MNRSVGGAFGAALLGVLLVVSTACSSDGHHAAGDGAEDRGARGTGDGAEDRGARGPDSCWSSSDCPGANGSEIFCVPPDNAFIVCGVCNPPYPAGCQSDGDCASNAGAASICLPNTCGCPTKFCAPGCTSPADCLEGLVCGSTRHCVAPPCDASTGTGCPVDFTCQPMGQCVRRTCTTDNDCAVACVRGACYSRAGKCSQLQI
jgi:hypothetical protein